MGLAHAVERADHAALEDAEEAFDRVRVSVAPDVFVALMVNRFVALKLGSDGPILARAIRHQRGATPDVLEDDRGQRPPAHVGDVKRASASATLNQREGDLLADRADILRVALR